MVWEWTTIAGWRLSLAECLMFPANQQTCARCFRFQRLLGLLACTGDLFAGVAGWCRLALPDGLSASWAQKRWRGRSGAIPWSNCRANGFPSFGRRCAATCSARAASGRLLIVAPTGRAFPWAGNARTRTAPERARSPWPRRGPDGSFAILVAREPHHRSSGKIVGVSGDARHLVRKRTECRKTVAGGGLEYGRGHP